MADGTLKALFNPDQPGKDPVVKDIFFFDNYPYWNQGAPLISWQCYLSLLIAFFIFLHFFHKQKNIFNHLLPISQNKAQYNNDVI